MSGFYARLLLLGVAALGSGSTCRGQSTGNEASAEPTTEVKIENLPGVDTSTLTPREKREWSGYVTRFIAPCPNSPVTVAECVKSKRDCAACEPAAKFLARAVRDGRSPEEVDAIFKARFDPKAVRSVALSDSPTKGPDDAPITIVEFADFECPFCAMYAPVLEKLYKSKPGKIRMVFKFMPLSLHPHGEIAARAGFAAWKQDKFWEMNARMFKNREHLEQSDLEAYARQLGLDVEKFKADMRSEAATKKLAADRKLADTLDVKGTPAIFINGRTFDLKQDIGDWVELDLKLLGDSGEAAPADPKATTDAGSKKGSGAHEKPIEKSGDTGSKPGEGVAKAPSKGKSEAPKSP